MELLALNYGFVVIIFQLLLNSELADHEILVMEHDDQVAEIEGSVFGDLWIEIFCF